MAKRYPGGRWIPTGDAGAMSSVRGCSWHEAVSRDEHGDGIAGWVRSAKSCHAYNGKNGDFAQYMDIGRKAYGVSQGNSTMLTVESYDGLKILENPYREVGIGGQYGDSANTGRWDAGQAERAADFMAWLNLDYGVPLRMMASSARSESGHAPHRWGIAPWRQPGGESWTAHDGKPCPGDLRVAQLPGIVQRAKVIAAAIKAGKCSYLPPGPVDVVKALARTGGKPTTPTTPTAPKPPTKPAPSPAYPAFPGVTKLGSRGAAVRSVQARLLARGWRSIGSVDGVFGPQTDKVVRAFQKEKRLTPDGVVGPRTWDALWTAEVTR